MRVQTYHHHTINRSSPLLSALVTINFIYFICFAIPVVAISLNSKWNIGITSGQQTWCTCIVVLWAVAEIPRLYFGLTSNQQQNVQGLIGFVGISLIPQLPFTIIYNVMWPHRDSLDYALSITLIMMLIAELLCSVKLLFKLMQNNRIDFFVYGMHLIREDRRF